MRWFQIGTGVCQGLYCHLAYLTYSLLVAQTMKCLPAMQETWVWSLGQEDPLEKEMATHSSTLAWKIPWAEEPGRWQSMGSQRVELDWVTSLSFFLSFFLSLTYIQSTSCKMLGWMKAQAGIKTARRNISNLKYADDTIFMAEGEELKSLLMKVKRRVKSWLKTQHSEN